MYVFMYVCVCVCACVRATRTLNKLQRRKSWRCQKQSSSIVWTQTRAEKVSQFQRVVQKPRVSTSSLARQENKKKESKKERKKKKKETLQPAFFCELRSSFIFFGGCANCLHWKSASVKKKSFSQAGSTASTVPSW